MHGAHVGEVEQHAQQLQLGVERVARQLDHLERLLDALQREVLGLGGDQREVGGDQRVDGEQAERWGAVDQHELVGVGGQLRQRPPQRQLASQATAERELGLGEVEVGGDHVPVDRLGGAGAPAQHVADRRLRVGGTSK